jgi:hypothetical protein
MALIVPLLWAVSSLVDCCLIGNQIYLSATDGTAVSCLLSIVPALLVLFWNWNPVVTQLTGEFAIPYSAILAGVFYAIHLFFYFRTLLRLNDTSGTETFLSLSVVVVPLLAWVILGELLPSHFYFAFLLAALGVTIQSAPVFRKMGLSLFLDMTICVVAVSLSMVLQARALQGFGFNIAVLAFSLTCVVVAVGLLLVQRKLRRRVSYLWKKHPLLLLSTELTSVIAVLISHRATQKAPSVSLVALIECLLPLAIIGLSFGLIVFNRYFPLLSFNTCKALVTQTHATRSKLIAFGLLLASLSILPAG